jgi:urease accessory protein
MSVALPDRRAVESASWHGRIELAFSRAGERTILERRRVQMPLAVQRPFYPEGPSVCHALLLHPPGGMVGGDRLDIVLDVGERAAALVSTPAAAKWYRGDAPATQAALHRVAGDAYLEWLPQETIVFNGANVRQGTRVELAPESAWLGWEITRFGRTARGESFDGGTWRMDTEVWRGSTPLWIDRQRLDGGSRLLRSRYGLAGAPVVGTLAWVGKAAPPELVEAARGEWDGDACAGETGVTRLEQGLLCRYRGPSSADARGWFAAVWNLVRGYDGRGDASISRIWMT